MAKCLNTNQLTEADSSRQLAKAEQEISSIGAKINKLEAKRDTLRRDYFNCYLEYNGLIARKYKLMSKSKRQAQ